MNILDNFKSFFNIKIIQQKFIKNIKSESKDILNGKKIFSDEF